MTMKVVAMISKACLHNLMKWVFGSTRAPPQTENILWLVENGFPTPVPVTSLHFLSNEWCRTKLSVWKLNRNTQKKASLALQSYCTCRSPFGGFGETQNGPTLKWAGTHSVLERVKYSKKVKKTNNKKKQEGIQTQTGDSEKGSSAQNDSVYRKLYRRKGKRQT